MEQSFAIYRGNRRFNNKWFNSYEEARKYVIRHLRKLMQKNGVVGYPKLSDGNFSIRRFVTEYTIEAA